MAAAAAFVAVLVVWGLSSPTPTALAVSASTTISTNTTRFANTAPHPITTARKLNTATASLRPSVAASLKVSLHAAPVTLPLVVEIPSIGVHSPLVAVGMTSAHAMSAPEGNASSPYWGDTFWYRGGAVPGAPGTATIAGHIDDAYGRYAVFGRLSSLVKGDRITIRNTKTGVSDHFKVTAVYEFSLAQAKTIKALDLIYGLGPPQGRAARPSRDGLAHLSLITCAGSWNTSLKTHNERLVVSAVRVK